MTMKVPASLTNRIFLASGLLLVTTIGIAIYRVNAAVAAQAEVDLRAGLDDAVSLVRDVTRTQAADFVIKGSLMADLPPLKAATATQHAPTVQPIAEQYRSQIASDLFMVAGRDGRILASAGRVTLDDISLAGLLGGCHGICDALVPAADGVLLAASFPMDPDAGPLGTLIVGFSLDQEFARRLSDLTDGEIAFVTGGRVVASTLARAFDRPLLDAAQAGGLISVQLGADDYLGRAVSLGPDEGGPTDLDAIVLHSRTEHLQFLPLLRWQIALTGLVAVLVATGVGYGIARTVTRPLRALTATMQDIARTGDLTQPPPASGRWDDEDARLLAATFGRLTGALRQFQTEAAQRERLSALGRLSATIAHEIRNPLMIIKSSVRSLRRRANPETADIADSINEEVERLDRVVADVLDFARPVRLSVVPADLSDICRDAARAEVTGRGADVVLEVPPTAPLATDPDRLRGVVANLLANARAALRADAGPEGTAPITLRVTPRHPDGWHLIVHDRGTGIPADDLPRVFDPFFTTRGTGSGLGLALARNIIEGLGGQIDIRSTSGAGTTVTIDLPARETGGAPAP